ncbi:uncharacterized protein LOC132947214 [Metopolophium dirhodum]|uniref:uncharacterized protein LOC132947214 n=1 Tax=Metopolophium dirhodum TaxID=44670 RepID=UPI002990027F|nr:uncharacterized protein LOC132947214 [Metopolophium dirhodum]
MTEQLNESPEKIQSEGRQPKIVVDPRLQSSHGSDDLENDYQFFRTLVKNNIFQLTNVSDQRAISTWLCRCDEERDKSLKCGIIKLMLVSLQHPSGNMKLFRHSAPKNLPYLINTPNYLRELVDDMLTNFDSDSDGDDEADCGSPLGSRSRRPRRRTVCTNTAAVSPDMTSIATAFTDNRGVQAFYARSDHAVNTWRLPDSVRFPVHSRSASRWEKALTTDCPLTARTADSTRTAQKNAKKEWDLPVFLPDEGKPWQTPKWNTSEADLTPMEQKCRGLMSEQMSPEGNAFRWYEHSRLDGSLRPMPEFCTDKDVCGQGKNQPELDERAINVTNKIYPERVQIVVDPRLIAEVVGTTDPPDRRQS